MNLSTHSISPQSARYAEKLPAASSDLGSTTEPKTGFAELVDNASERRETEEPKNGTPRTDAPRKSCRQKSSATDSRKPTKEKAAAKHQPNESLISKTDVPLEQQTEELPLEDAEIVNAGEPVDLSGKNDLIPGEETEVESETETPAFSFFEDDAGETLELSQSTTTQDGAVPHADRAAVKADTDAVALVETTVADVAVVADSEVGQGKPRNATAFSAPKRGGVKSFDNLDDKLAADFAESRTDVPAQPKRDHDADPKNFLEAKEQEVTKREEFLGINVAKPAASMNHEAPIHELSGLLTKQLAAHEGAALSNFETQTSTVAHEALSGIHRAINTVVEAGEKLRSVGSRAVDLQFSFGSDDLSVRVELHEGKVRATFRTDSAELRGALAQEWQVLNASAADRAKRFADPVFAANSSAFAAGDQQEKQGSRKQDLSALKERFEISNSPSVSAATSARTNAPAALPQTAAPLTALRLHTFA